MQYYSVPADFKSRTLHQIDEINQHSPTAKIYETYGQVTVGNIIGSGRANDLLPSINMQELKCYIKESERCGIGFNYTLNTTCLGNREFSAEGVTEIQEFLYRLKDAGVSHFTIASPSLMQIVTQMNCGFTIKASTVCGITNANKARMFIREHVSHIVVDESINRDFQKIKEIREAFGPRVELIVNVICHKDCIYERFHHNQTSHDISCDSGTPSVAFYSNRCMLQRCDGVETLLKLAWIRPEDTHLYENIGIQFFKIQGRQAVHGGGVLKTAQAYLNGKYDGNLMELLDCFSNTNSFVVNLPNRLLDGFVDHFYQNPSFCTNNCDACHYCNNYIHKIMDIKDIESVFQLARQFYGIECNYLKNNIECREYNVKK